MLRAEQAQEYLREHWLINGANRLLRRIQALPSQLRQIALDLLGVADESRVDEFDFFVCGRNVTLEGLEAIRQFDQLEREERERIMQAYLPELWQWMLLAWDNLYKYPCNYETDLILKRSGKQSLNYDLERVKFLRVLVREICSYEGDIEWWATWAGFMWQPGYRLSYLFAAAIDSGTPEGEKVFDIFMQTLKGEHEIAHPNQYAYGALFAASRPEGWQLCENLLLAAQRQEGTRQQILRTAACGLPEPFLRILRLILDENLLRFSSVCYETEHWLHLGWDRITQGALRRYVEEFYKLLTDAQYRKQALASDDAQLVCLALCSAAFYDVDQAIKEAEKLLQHPATDHRFVAVHMLTRCDLPEANRLLVSKLEDDDMRIFGTVLSHFACRSRDKVFRQSDWHESDFKPVGRTNFFERLVAVKDRVPKKPVVLKPIAWPWMRVKISPETWGTVLVLSLPIEEWDRLVPYLDRLSIGDRIFLAAAIKGNLDVAPKCRKLVEALLADRASTVRTMAFEVLSKFKPKPSDLPLLVGLLEKQSATLRNQVLAVMLAFGNKTLLETVEQLVEGPKPKRLAALGLLQLMLERNRSVANVAKIVEQYRDKFQKTQQERKLLQQLENKIEGLGEKKQETAENLGLLELYRLDETTPPTLPEPSKTAIATPAAINLLKSLDQWIDKHRNVEVTVKSPIRTMASSKKLLGNLDGGDFPAYLPKPREAWEDIPAAELWQQWNKQRGEDTRDKDGLELWRAALTFWMHGTFKLPRLRYESLVRPVVSILAISQPVTQKVVELLVTSCEEYLLTFLSLPKKKGDQPGLGRLLEHMPSIDYSHYFSDIVKLIWDSKKLSRRQLARLWNILRYILTAERARYRSLSINPYIIGDRLPNWTALSNLIAKAQDAGIATEADLMEAMILSIEIWSALSLPGLSRKQWQDYCRRIDANTRKFEFDEHEIRRRPWFQEFSERIIDRILETELNRTTLPTAATWFALNVEAIWGIDRLVKLLKALQQHKVRLTAAWRLYHCECSLPKLFRHLVGKCYPYPDETWEQLARAVKTAKISQEMLLDLAFVAPQWAGMVEKIIDWPGLKNAVWWIASHHLSDWDFSQRFGKHKGELTAEELKEGAVDVVWFRQIQEQLGTKRLEKLLERSQSIGCKINSRGRIYADALLGKADRKQLVANIRNKLCRTSLVALSILPLPGGRRRMADLQERYQIIQEFLRNSRQLGPMRQSKNKRAGEMALANLARLAGYGDRYRLSWFLEKEALSDIQDGQLTQEIDGFTVTLSIDEFCRTELTIQRDGKRYKTVPAALKKNEQFQQLRQRRQEISRQVSRIRYCLEDMMCCAVTFSGEELRRLVRHPLVGPMIRRLVLVGVEGLGYPVCDGQALEDYNGRRIVVAKHDQLRIAHPLDLYRSGKWHLWQRDCFRRELVQPFKQVFRELYVVTEGEKKAGPRSQRYAGHQVSPNQASALLSQRGWLDTVTYNFWPHKVFSDYGIVAHLDAEEPYDTPAAVEGLTINSVYFIDSKKNEFMPLDKVPPIIFSEVMRDLDLVVSVAHMGGVDPEATASTIEMRRALLRETLAVLGIDNVEIKENYAVIHGKLAEYNIHLGSGVVRLMPGTAIVVVPVHSQRRGRIFLPFADDDPKTAEVLSKILLFAKDNEIKDPAILDQIDLVTGIATQPLQHGRKKAAKKRKQKQSCRLETEGKSGKRFWEISVSGKKVTIQHGTVGKKPRTIVKQFSSAEKARQFAQKAMAQKEKAGYQQVSGNNQPPA